MEGLSSDRELGTLSTKVDAILARLESHTKILNQIIEDQVSEAVQCPFHPKQKQNGHSLIKRVARIEYTLIVFAGLIAVDKGPGVWDVVRRFLGGG